MREDADRSGRAGQSAITFETRAVTPKSGREHPIWSRTAYRITWWSRSNRARARFGVCRPGGCNRSAKIIDVGAAFGRKKGTRSGQPRAPVEESRGEPCVEAWEHRATAYIKDTGSTENTKVPLTV